jgi:hypothetical protein
VSSLYLGRWARAGRCTVARPTVIIDLDETLVWRPRGIVDKIAMYTAPWMIVGRPYEGAIAGVQSLAEKFNVVAVTARWQLAEASTEHMLATAGLARMPVIYAGDIHPGDASRVAYKARAIRHLRDEGWAPFAGIGDRASDVKAYTDEGLTALVVLHAEGVAPDLIQTRMTDLMNVEQEVRRKAAVAAKVSGATPTPRIIYFTDCPLIQGTFSSSSSRRPVWNQILDDYSFV